MSCSFWDSIKKNRKAKRNLWWPWKLARLNWLRSTSLVCHPDGLWTNEVQWLSTTCTSLEEENERNKDYRFFDVYLMINQLAKWHRLCFIVSHGSPVRIEVIFANDIYTESNNILSEWAFRTSILQTLNTKPCCTMGLHFGNRPDGGRFSYAGSSSCVTPNFYRRIESGEDGPVEREK